jgi:hypothetical protein
MDANGRNSAAPAERAGVGTADEPGGATPHVMPPGESPADAFRGFGPLLAELGEYVSYFLSAKIDAVKVTARNVGIYAALGIVGLFAGCAFVITAVVLLMMGLANGLGELLGHRPWAGALIIGGVVLGGLAVGIVVTLKKVTNMSRDALVRKYENRQREQRSKFGHDVRGRDSDPTR